MPVFFKMSCRGLDSINRRVLSEPAQILLAKILYYHGQRPVSMEQLFDYLDSDRKTAARLLYKMLHTGWLINIKELQITANDEEIAALPSLQNVVDNNQIILSEQRGLLISVLGFSSEESLNLAANAAELLKKHVKKHVPDISDSKYEDIVFPVFSTIKWQNTSLEFRLVQIQDMCFIITTTSSSKLNGEFYFDLIYQLFRRYGSEYKQAIR